MSTDFALRLRLARLHRHGQSGLFVVPLDHSVTDGPTSATPKARNALLSALSGSGVDAIVLHKGSLRHLDPRCFQNTSLIVHLSASTRHAADPDAKYLVTTIEEAVRRGADAVSVHVNLGSLSEAAQVADLGAVANLCDQWRMPLLAMVYPRGPAIADSRDAKIIAHAATLAADLGADIVKVPYAGTPTGMAEVVRSCPVPVIVAGGPRLAQSEEVLAYVDEVLSAGVAGLAMGRNIFEAPDPGALAREIAGRVHAIWSRSESTGPGLRAVDGGVWAHG